MRLTIASIAAALTTAAVAAGPALADGSSPAVPAAATTTTTSTTPTTPTPTPPTPVKASTRVYIRNAFFVAGHVLIVPKRALTAQGVVKPFVAGQRVRVTATVNHHLIKTELLRVWPSRNGHYGRFSMRVASPTAGILRVQVVHRRSAQQLGFSSLRAVQSLTPGAGFGATGRFVQLLQAQLAAVHIYVPQTGVYDQQTGLAIDAYHRLLGWGTSQTLDGSTISALLDSRGTFAVRHPRDGKHVEGDLGKQLLALIYGSKVYRIYPISSGKPSTPTVLGHFRVYQRDPGYLPDGMYYSSFFYGNFAIHGFDPAPDYAASHGCMRLPIIDAISVYDWLSNGNVVDVYQ